jgi:hypothetical protein
MQLVYTKVKSTDKNFPFFLHPLVTVNIYNRTRKLTTKAHLDTGADQTLINAGLAKALGIDNYKKGIETVTWGIEGVPQKVYLHDIELEVDGLPNSRYKTNVGFMKSNTIGVLLGQLGFF